MSETVVNCFSLSFRYPTQQIISWHAYLVYMAGAQRRIVVRSHIWKILLFIAFLSCLFSKLFVTQLQKHKEHDKQVKFIWCFLLFYKWVRWKTFTSWMHWRYWKYFNFKYFVTCMFGLIKKIFFKVQLKLLTYLQSYKRQWSWPK